MTATLGNSKTALTGTYPHVSAKHAHAYLAGFAWRFNRRSQLDTLTDPLLRAGLPCPPKPYRIIVDG